VLNDATYADAQETGLTNLVRVIDDGGDAPALILEDCEPSFQGEFKAADLVIVKGQGNFEAVIDTGAAALPKRFYRVRLIVRP
jgi:uncharacterized protein with ATP-grasp and redox domains